MDLLLCQNGRGRSSLTHSECGNVGDLGSVKNLNDACSPPWADL